MTIDGKDTYAFKFASDYSNGKINGAATVDTITAAGDNLNINANKGDDIITVSGKNVTVAAGEGNDQITITGSAASINGGKGNDTIKGNGKDNVFFYAQGDGNDVIVNFAPAKDTIKTSAQAKNVSVAQSGSDAVITIGTGNNIGTITLKGKGSSADSINIVDNSNKPIEYTVASSDVLLADDNYSMDAAALGDITEPFKASFTPYDFEASLDLVKKDSFTPAITYSDKK